MKTQKNKITKNNDFILKARYNLTLFESKVIALLLADIKKDENYFKVHTFDYKYFTNKVGYKKKSRIDLMLVLDKLQRQTYQLDYINENGKRVWRVFNFLEYAEIIEEDLIKLKFNIKMEKYILNLKNNFTTYELSTILSFDSVYTTRIYEILKVKYDQYRRYKNDDNILFETNLDEFKKFLGIENKYPRFFDFNKRVLEPVQKELEEKADIHLLYKTVKTSRTITGLQIYPNSSEELKLKQDYYNFINDIKTKCINMKLFTTRNKKGNVVIISINEKGFLYSMNTDDNITKDWAFKIYQWMYKNQKNLNLDVQNKVKE